MLGPDDRTLLTNLLAPPGPDYKLERALATTFTLDLAALLPAMLGFAGRAIDESANQLSVLQAIREFSDRVDVFCQAGAISVPQKSNALIELVHEMVHQVKAPRGGLFHPKLWLLRFVSDDDERFRLVCGSRNLTFDKSWDTALVLEGVRTRQPKAANRPVFEWVRSILDRVPTGIDQQRKDAMTDLADGFRYVEWEPISGQLGDSPKFYFFGPGRATWPDMSGYNRLVVSPFITDDGLDQVWPNGDCTIISRPEVLDALENPSGPLASPSIRCFNDDAALPDPNSDQSGLQWALNGLHSKLYVVERDGRAHVMIGSANATGPAWNLNDEVLVEIVGRIGIWGVEALVGEKAPMRKLLIDYSQGEKPEESPQANLRERLERALRDFAAIPLDATVAAFDDKFALRLGSADPINLPAVLGDNAVLEVAPRTNLKSHRDLQNGKPVSAEWTMTSVEEITPFFSVRLRGEQDGVKAEAESMLLARLHGDPPDRLDRVFTRNFKSPEQLMQFILAVLQFADVSDFESGAERVGNFEPNGAGGSWGDAGESGLLESVLGALVDSPASIDDIERMTKPLAKTAEGRDLLPEEWDEFWSIALEARKRIEGEPDV